MNRESLIANFACLLPLAVEWATDQQHRILEEGVPLAGQEVKDAATAAVRAPDRVRLLSVPTIPRPEHPALEMACDAIDFLTSATRGLTLGYGIFIRQDCWRDRALIAHELVHVAQYERMDGMEPFLRKYLMECLTVGYADSSLEREAIITAARIVSGS